MQQVLASHHVSYATSAEGNVAEPSESVVEHSTYGQLVLCGQIFTFQNKSVRLFPYGARLLRLLMEANGVVVPHKRLFAAIGYKPMIKTHTVPTHFYRVRLALAPMGVIDVIKSDKGYFEGRRYIDERGYLMNLKSGSN